MKINCIGCGHKVELDDAYNNYEGHVKCFICGGMLKIKTKEGNLKSVTLMNISPPQSIKEAFDSTHP